MTENALNRLMIDRALGELAPDVAELLDAYLEKDSRREEAHELEKMVDMARRTLAEKRSRSLPPLKLHALALEPQQQSWMRDLWWPVAAAAALVVGVSLGFVARRPPGPAWSGSQGAAGPVSMVRTSVDAGAGFWSLNRLTKRESAATVPETVPHRTWQTFINH